MLRRLLSATLVAGALAVPASASDDRIDADPDACLDGETTTTGMVACSGAARDAWDAALNDVYASLVDRLSKEEGGGLRESRRAWIRFRDAEPAFLAGLLTPDRGTMMRIAVNAMTAELVKQRVLALRGLAETESAR